MVLWVTRIRMDHETAATPVTPLTIRIVRHLALLAAPLLLLGASLIWPDFDQATISLTALVLLFIGLLTFVDRSARLRHPKNLVIIVPIAIFAGIIIGFFYWRAGTVVAAASFNPGIAPFDITVREVPVPVTHSHHFIVTLK